MEPGRGRFSEGRLQSAGALALAVATTGIVAVSSWTSTESAGRLAIVGFVVFALALSFGSTRFVGLATLPMLGSALMASAAAAEPAWVQSIMVGSLWYVAVELAWDGIERRDRTRRTRALADRRSYEIATVVLLALAVSTVGFLFSSLAPARTLLLVGPVVLILLVGLNRARGLVADARSLPETTSSHRVVERFR